MKIKLRLFQSSEVGLFAGLRATQQLISSGQGGISKMKVAFICHNIKEVVQKCRKIRGLGCVNHARVTQPSPCICLHICTYSSFIALKWNPQRIPHPPSAEDLQLACQPPLRAAARQGPRIGENVNLGDEVAPHQTSPDFDW